VASAQNSNFGPHLEPGHRSDQQAKNTVTDPATVDSVAIIILSWNQREATLHCLRSLVECGYSLHQTVVWDNGSGDGTVDAVRLEFTEPVVRASEVNLGVASGRNAAAGVAVEAFQPAYLLFLDNDMAFTPGFVEALLRPFGNDRRLAQTVGKILQMDDKQRLNAAGGAIVDFPRGTITPVGYGEIDNGQFDTVRKCLPNGGGSMVRADVFCHLSGFDTCFDPYGPEDLDFSFRVREAGYYGLYVPDAVICHQHERTVSDGDFAESYARDKMQHWMILLSRHATPAQKLRFYMVGGPLGFVRIVLRELFQGNLSALKGILSGIIRQLVGGVDSK
jgi:GT2 family glycosyltransferase